MNFFSCFQNNYFTNWSENIINKKTSIKYPVDYKEIKEILLSARIKNKIIRVVGSKHSISHCVIDPIDNNVILISLEKYKLESGDLIIDHNNLSVTVNAGWKLGTLYDELNQYGYFLETQPASSAFTIGGIVSMPVHGSRLGAGIVSDSVIAMTLINEYGEKISKNQFQEDFNLYRLNLGLFGIITSVTFKLIKITNIESRIMTFNNIFYNNNSEENIKEIKIKKNLIDYYFKKIIENCVDDNKNYPEFNQCFIDFHNNALLCIDWKNCTKNCIINENYPNSTNVYKIQTLELLFKDLYKNFRKDNKLLQIIGKSARHDIQYNIEKNLSKDNDMFWISIGIRCYFMSYFIPIYEEGEYMLEKLYDSIEYVMKLTNQFKREKKYFNIDLPMELRFVSSNTQSKLSPLYNENKIIFASIEIVCSATNIELNSEKIKEKNRKINEDFREFFYLVEQCWIMNGGIPHLSKLYGFSSIKGDPFDKTILKKIFSDKLKDEIKNEICKTGQLLFINQFMRDIIE